MARWPNTTTALCTPEQLADSIAGYMLSGEVADADELHVLLCCAFHLPVASLLAVLAGEETMHAAISWASRLRAGERTSAIDGPTLAAQSA